MKIAIDLRRIKNPGIGRYMKCLTEALLLSAPEHEYLLILPPDGLDLSASSGDKVTRIAPPLKYYSVREQVELPRILRRHKVDLLHSPHFNLPLIRPCATVVTIHDVIYLACKEDLPSRVGRTYYGMMMAASVRLADRVITDSEYSRQDILRFLNAKPSKIDVIYPAVEPGFAPVADPLRLAEVRRRYGIGDDYIIYTGIYKLRKNHAGLLRAFRNAVDRGCRAQLVVAGPMNEGEAPLRQLAAELGISGQVKFTGFVADSDLPALYSGAKVYACPSLYEGFGFTLLEAMQCGVPVVCSHETSVPEVAGTGALYADARDPSAFGEALYRMLTDASLREHYIGQGKANLLRFDWEKTAAQTLAVYENAVATPRRKMAYA